MLPHLRSETWATTNETQLPDIKEKVAAEDGAPTRQGLPESWEDMDLLESERAERAKEEAAKERAEATKERAEWAKDEAARAEAAKKGAELAKERAEVAKGVAELAKERAELAKEKAQWAKEWAAYDMPEQARNNTTILGDGRSGIGSGLKMFLSFIRQFSVADIVPAVTLTATYWVVGKVTRGAWKALDKFLEFVRVLIKCLEPRVQSVTLVALSVAVTRMVFNFKPTKPVPGTKPTPSTAIPDVFSKLCAQFQKHKNLHFGTVELKAVAPSTLSRIGGHTPDAFDSVMVILLMCFGAASTSFIINAYKSFKAGTFKDCLDGVGTGGGEGGRDEAGGGEGGKGGESGGGGEGGEGGGGGGKGGGGGA